MATQPSNRPDEPSNFFADGRANRPLVPGSIARGQLRTDHHLFRGKRGTTATANSQASLLMGSGGNSLSLLTFVGAQYYRSDADDDDTFPFAMTREVLEHGRNRFMIYCVVCHDTLGTGHGMIVERGYTQPPSYHIERLRQVAVGHFFDVITNGYGSMPSYKQQVPPRDRWAIAGYIRALQLSQHFPVNDLTVELKNEWQKALVAQAGGKKP